MGAPRAGIEPDGIFKFSQGQVDPQVETAIRNYETAYRMQTAIPEIMELRGETAATRKLYGMDSGNAVTAAYGKQCLLARRLVERGVRFIELLGAGAVFAGVHTDFPAKHLREMTGTCIADFEADIDDGLVGLAQQSACLFHAQACEVLGWCETGAFLERPREVCFAQAGVARESTEVEVAVQSQLHGRKRSVELERRQAAV